MTPAAWAWAGLGLLIALYVGGFDAWALITHHLTMSGQGGRWLYSKAAGPILVFVVVGGFLALLYHISQERGR